MDSGGTVPFHQHPPKDESPGEAFFLEKKMDSYYVKYYVSLADEEDEVYELLELISHMYTYCPKDVFTSEQRTKIYSAEAALNFIYVRNAIEEDLEEGEANDGQNTDN